MLLLTTIHYAIATVSLMIGFMFGVIAGMILEDVKDFLKIRDRHRPS